MRKEIIEQAKLLGLMILIGIAILLLISIVNEGVTSVKEIKRMGISPILEKQLSWNNITLEDSTVYNPITNVCNASKYGMTITISNCKAQDIDGTNIEQPVVFEWNGAIARNISWIFVYDGDLERGSISALMNKTKIEYYFANDWVSNYLVDRVTGTTNLTTKPSYCNLGSLNNTQWYRVNRTYINGTLYSQIVCFSQRSIVNSTAFLISGNNDVSATRNVIYQDYVDVTDRVTYLGKGLLNDDKSYYKVNDVRFDVGEIIDTKWVYTPKNKAKSGKWHILGYDSETGLVASIQSGQYLYIDPWWSGEWNKKKQITNVTSKLAWFNVTYDSDMQTDFDDLRFVDGSETIELNYTIRTKVDGASAVIGLDTNDNATVYMYYGNPSATKAENASKTLKQPVAYWYFDGNALDAVGGTNGVNLTAQTYNTTGKFYGAVNLKASKINVTNAGSMGATFSGSGQWTMVGWERASDNAGDRRSIFGINTKGVWASSADHVIVMKQFDNNHLNNYMAKYPSEYYQDSTDALSASAWNFVSTARNATQSAVYINAVIQGQRAWGVADMGTMTETWFGVSPEGNAFQGQISDFGVYNRDLKTAELRFLYNTTKDGVIFGAEETGTSAVQINLISQYPTNITATNIANVSIVISYNITHPNPINISQTSLFWLTNGTGRSNFTWYINGTIPITGFTTAGVTLTNYSNTIWNFTLGDNIYPATYLINLSLFDNAIHSTTNLTTDNHLIKALVLNMTGTTRYNFLEFMIENMTPTTASLRIYYCNSTYTNGNIGTNPNCALVGDMPTNQTFSHVENQSRHYLISLTINNTIGTLSGIKVTESGYFVWRGRTGGWATYTVPTISRTDAIQTSTNTGIGYSNLAATLDYHLHQFSSDETFNYYACSNATTGSIYNCSTTTREFLDRTVLPPSPPIVYVPVAGTYVGNITINYTGSISPQNTTITQYSIFLYNQDDTFNRTIRANNGLNLSWVYDTSADSLVNGTFNIHVYAYDALGQFAFGESDDFYVNNTFNSTTYVNVTPSSPITYPIASNFSCSNNYNLPTDMFVNGINRTNQKGLNVTRGVGTYSIICVSYTVGQVLGSTSSASIFTINKGVPPLTISFTGGINVTTYPVAIGVNGNGCPTELSCQLRIDDIAHGGITVVANPYSGFPHAGAWGVDYITTGNDNYTAFSYNDSAFINKANASLGITLSPASEILNGTIATITGTGCPDETCVMYLSGSNISNPYIYNFTTLGNYPFNYTMPSNDNYNDWSAYATLSVVPMVYGGTNGTINFTTTNLSQTKLFQVPLNFTTHAYMNVSGATPQSCYQEATNSTTTNDGSCNLNYTGSYAFEGGSDAIYNRLIDKNWSTNTQSGSGALIKYYMNYTKPNTYITGAVWQIKDTNGTYNITIPSDCFNFNATKLSLTIIQDAFSLGIENTNTTYFCFNGTNKILKNSYVASANFEIYEEAVIWNSSVGDINISIGSTSIFSQTGIFNITNKTSNFYNTLNKYLFGCTYDSQGFCVVPIKFNSSTFGALTYSEFTFDNVGFIENSNTFIGNTTETQATNFSLNISYDSSAYNLKADLMYNGSAYPAQVNIDGFNATINRTLLIPTGNGTIQFYWRINMTNSTGSYYYNSSFANQTVKSLSMSICGSPNTIPFLNYTFHNETLANQAITATLTSSFTYWLSDPSVNKTYSFTNASENGVYSFCFLPASSQIYVKATGTYDNSFSQPRSFENSSMLLTNSTTIKDLLLLPDSSGIYITFIVQNAYGGRLSNALIDVRKTAGNIPIEQKYTDGTGSAAFWLDTTTSYTIIVTKSGYDDYSTGITPTSSPVTITMTASSSGGGGGGSSSGESIDISISPTGQLLENRTTYNFVYAISSTGKDFDGYGFSIWNASTLLNVGKTGNAIHGETLSLSFNTGNQSYIVMRYYYIVDGVYTNATKIWVVESSDGTDYSIGHAIGTFNKFTKNTTGIFGINQGTTSGNFSFAIILFIVILFFAGSMTYKYGITSQTAVMFVIFSIVLFVDVGAGWFEAINPVGAVDHFITIVVGVVTLGLFIKEAIT